MYQPSMSTILIVEENQSLGAIIHQTLKHAYRVFVKNDPAAAFTFLFQGNIPDLIILDFNRDQLELKELLFELRQNSFFKEIPLVVLGDDPEFLASGAQYDSTVIRLISKPFNPNDILDCAQKILRPSEHPS